MRALEPGDPREVGRYRLLARLGAGGMAVVYFGRSPGRRAVAVKLMHADLSADPAYRERFRREVGATTAVAGRYCPAVLDAGPDAEVPWLVTEFLPSVSVREAVREHGPFRADATWPLAAGLAEALESVHRAGIVHLDVKPSNVLLTADGPRLIDFGISAATGSAGSPAGTWGFMSPEQAAAGPVGAASDVYSLGATLAFACTGVRHGAAGLLQIADARLRAVVARCLDPDPRGRPTIAELVDVVSAASEPTGGPWLPAAVRADIDRRVGEAGNPPVALAAEPPPGPVRRRTLVLAAGGLAAVALGAAAAVVLAEGGPPTGSAPPPVGSATTSVPVSPSARTRTIEFLLFGRTTLRTVTTEVNGEVETVVGAPLPYRRVVEVPAEPAPLRWRFSFRSAAGQYSYVITVDGWQVRSGGGSSTVEDMAADASSDT